MKTPIPPQITQEIESRTQGSILKFLPSTGGCINSSGKIITSGDNYFLKWNDRDRFPEMFNAEAKGLSLLREKCRLLVPSVICAGIAGDHQFLLLENIDESVKAKDFWQQFGSGLASLHRNTTARFGLDHDNYIGSLPQQNKPLASWIDFFIYERLEFQLEMGRNSGRIDAALTKKFDALYKHLPLLLPHEPPALLHGDLWSGNLMTSGTGAPCLIDPAVYYGSREADLAMTQLFGGFDPVYFDSYNDAYPLEPGYKERLDLYNLYPLLVHVNLFGGSYAGQVVSILNRFL